MRSFFEKKRIIKSKVKKMYELIIQISNMSLDSLLNNDLQLSEKTVELDKKVNKAQKKIQDSCLNCIATDQPVAKDLRFLICSIKIIDKLEEIGDNHKFIVKSLSMVENEFTSEMLVKAEKLIKESLNMIGICMSCFVEEKEVDLKLILKKDDFINSMYDELNALLITLNSKNPTPGIIRLALLLRSLEKVGDYITEISTEIYFIVNGSYIDKKNLEKL